MIVSPEQIAHFKEQLEIIIDFCDSSIVWGPMYILAVLFIISGWYGTYKKLRKARKQIRVLNLEKEMLFQEQTELKSIIKNKSLLI